MRPLLSYYGGKQRLASKILPLFPPHTVYVEPFCGGAALLFAKPRVHVTNGHDYREVLNDHDQRLITVYRVLQDPELAPRLRQALAYTPYSRDEHARAGQILHTWPDHPLVTQAWAMVLGLQQSFANHLGSGWNTAVIACNHAATWASWQASLDIMITRLQGVYLECDEALSVIERWDSPQTLLYCDPPYPGANQGHYAGYLVEDYQRLIDRLATCQSSVLLSGYAHADLVMPDTWEMFRFAAVSSASGQGQTGTHDRTRKVSTDELGDRRRTEVVYRVDRSHGMRSELQWVRTTQGTLWDEEVA